MTKVTLETLKEIDARLAEPGRAADAELMIVQALRFIGLALVYLAQEIGGKAE